MGDRMDQIVREITATRVKLDNLCAKVDMLCSKLDSDHDLILKNHGRLNNLEAWVRSHEKQHDDLEKRIRKIVSDLEEIVKKMKEVETSLSESRRMWMAKVTIGAAIVGGLCGAIATGIFGVLFH